MVTAVNLYIFANADMLYIVVATAANFYIFANTDILHTVVETAVNSTYLET